METIKIVIKRWHLSARDFLNSLYLGVLSPTLYTLADYLFADGIAFTKESLLKLGGLALSTFVGNLFRKFVNGNKVVTVTPLGLREPEPEPPTDGDDTKPVPPPLGDPTHPTK